MRLLLFWKFDNYLYTAWMLPSLISSWFNFEDECTLAVRWLEALAATWCTCLSHQTGHSLLLLLYLLLLLHLLHLFLCLHSRIMRQANPAWPWDSQPRAVGSLRMENQGEMNLHCENGPPQFGMDITQTQSGLYETWHILLSPPPLLAPSPPPYTLSSLTQDSRVWHFGFKNSRSQSESHHF